MQCFGYYQAQRSWGTVIFSQVCVILFTGGGGSASVHAGIPPPPPRADPPGSRQTVPPGAETPVRTDIPLEQTPPGADTPLGADPPDQAPLVQRMLGDTVNARAVHILLECNLCEKNV